MRSLVVALKEWHEAVRLTAVASALAEPGAEVAVIHVAEIGHGGGFAEADAMVQAGLELLRARGLAAHGGVEPMAEGAVADRLTERVRESGAELVVIGSRGLGHVSALLRGSVSHALIARLDAPVVVVPADARLPLSGFRRVLVALRAEDEVGPATAAIRLLRRPVEILAVHVPRVLTLHAGSEREPGFVEVPETSALVLARARERMRESDIEVTTRSLERGHGVAGALAGTARDWDADLIILGSRRLHHWQALIAGSTAHEVLHCVDRPVLIAGRA